MTKMTYGQAAFRFGDEEEGKNVINTGPAPIVRRALYENFVANGTLLYQHYPSAQPTIGRFGRFRYFKPALPPDWWCTGESLSDAGVDDQWIDPGRIQSWDNRNTRFYGSNVAMALTHDSLAVGSVGVRANYNESVYPPNGLMGNQFVSFIDLPGTVVGNKFKHPIGRASLFNEVGQVSTSQGNLSVLGVFDPPENLAYHYGYQAYYTKSGGTGKATGTGGVDGSAINATTFRSAAYNFVAGDIGKFIKVTDGQSDVDEYIYEIKSINGTDAVTDSDDVNQPFVAHAPANIVWELVEGPIAEYFVRRRRYNHFDTWGSMTGVFSRYLTWHQHALVGRVPDATFAQAMTLKSLHDRGACWWILSNAENKAGYEEFGLLRLMDEGPMPLDPFYADGDITDMPTGILAWRHMDIDKNDKIWIATDDTTAAVGASVFRVDPYPLDGGGHPNAENPIRLNQLAKQVDMTMAGLPSETALGVVCDNTNGDAVHGRTWIVCGVDASVDGGLYYSEDGGATMKGLVHEKTALTGTNLWNVAGDGVTVTNPAADALLHFELVAGEWITFEDGLKGESKRQVASITDANTLVLTAATTFGGAQPGLIMAKGAINGAHIGLYFAGTSPGGWTTDGGQNNSAVDHDSSGRLYWNPADYTQGVVRFDPDSTNPVEFIDRVSLYGGYGTMDRCHHVGVTRMPDPMGLGSIWHDNVWVGGGYLDYMTRIYDWESYTNSGQTTAPDQFQDAGRPFVAGDVGKWVRIHKSTGGNDATRKILAVVAGVATLDTPALANETNICWELFGTTRYVYSAGPPANNFPDVVYVGVTWNEPAVVQDRVNGDIWLRVRNRSDYQNDASLYPIETMLPTTDADCGALLSAVNWNVIGNYYFGNGYPCVSGNTGVFDDLGMGTFMVEGYHYYNVSYDHREQPSGRLVAPRWACLLWDGGQWVHGPLNSYLADIDFDGSEVNPGPYAENVPALGRGLRRATDWAVPLEHGLCLRFDQAGGPTAQAAEFVGDENTTWVCATGRIKDNTMTAEWRADVNYFPTVVRQDEPSADVGSPGTVVNGWDGGYINDANDQAFPPYCRGIAEGNDYGASNGVTSEYFDFWNMKCNNPANPQYMVAMRIHDEAVHAAGAATGLDIATVGGVGKATDSAGANFIDADVGKTLRVEGAANVANNTSRVITALDGASPQTTVSLDAPWPAADEVDLAWRVRDIPEVSFVSLLVYLQEHVLRSFDWRLLSSRDGVNWDVVKQMDDNTGAVVDSLISAKIDPGSYWNRGALNPYGNDWQLSADYNRLALTFDLTTSEIDTAQRRRTYWKIVRNNPNAYGGDNRPMTMLLLDNNYAPIINHDLMPTDRLDPLWLGLHTHELRTLFHESVGAVSIGQSTITPIAYGDVVTEAGAGYWLQNAGDIIAYANTSKVTSVSASFTWQDVGRRLRLPNADIVLAVDEVYSGFLTLVNVIDANTAEVERTFKSQAAGVATITNNGGQALISEAGHPLVNGDAVTIAGTPSYDGEYIAVNVVAGVSFEIGVAYVADEAGTWDKGQIGLTWATVNFGALDRVRFYDTATWYQHLGRALTTVSYKIVDVPTTNTVRVEYMDIPSGVVAAFAVERSAAEVNPYGGDFENGELNYTLPPRTGIWNVNDDGQFNIIDEDTNRSAASGADVDGDGWADDITITGFNVPGAVDDWILLYNPSAQADDRYRRWYKIRTITPGANTVLTTYEDEIPPGETFKWKIARKRDMRVRLTHAVVSAREPI